MTARHFRFVALFSLLISLAASQAGAQDAAVPEVVNARQSFIGKITGSAVYVRSGPGENYYPTLKLDAGAEVTVVGIKFDWLKITPPEGSFSYVAKAFVDKSDDGAGIVNRDEVNVRTGSALNAMKTSIQSKLSKGEKVRILDERDEYYMIQPPEDAYVFVNKQSVEPVRPVAADNVAGGSSLPVPPVHEPGIRLDESDQARNPTTAPADEQLAAATTQPAVATEFDRLEADFTAASNGKIEEQPIKALLDRYNRMLADPSLPESMKRVADFRVRTLTARSEAKEQFLAVQKMQEQSKQRQMALRAEQEEIAQQIKKNEVKLYAAVGALRTSSFQSGQTTLYRLTDPASGRTCAYVRSNDPKYATLIGQFVGVKGDITTESALSMKVVTPTEVEAVDQTQVLKSIASQIVPPSLLRQATVEQASTGND